MNKYLLLIVTAATTVMCAEENISKDKPIKEKPPKEKPTVSICQKEAAENGGAVTTILRDTRSKVSALAHGDKVVLKNFDILAETLSHAYHKEKSMTAQEVAHVCEGIEFAANKHRLQTRKNAEKTPYISHPLGVAYNVMHYGDVRDTSIILGALLHDTIEDTQTTMEELEKMFGLQVAGYVKEVTDNRSLAQEERKRLQVVNASHKSPGATQIKLADKLYNLNDLLHNPPKEWTQMRIDRYYEWAQSVINRLPKANEQLLQAVNDVINTYWEKQQTPQG